MAARGKNRQFPTAYKLKAIERGEGVLPVSALSTSSSIAVTVLNSFVRCHRNFSLEFVIRMKPGSRHDATSGIKLVERSVLLV